MEVVGAETPRLSVSAPPMKNPGSTTATSSQGLLNIHSSSVG